MADLKPFAGLATALKQDVSNAALASILDALGLGGQTALSILPGSDMDGVDVLDSLLDDGGDLSLAVRIKNPDRRDAAGALILSDAPLATQWFNGAIGPGPLLDTQGYQSIVISFTAASGTYQLQTGNDPSVLGAVASASGWPTINATQPVSSVVAAAGLTIVVPVTGRWFRLYCSAAGVAGMTILQLRLAAPVNPSVTTAVTATVAGGQAVGAAATAAPAVAGAVDAAGLVVRQRADANGYLSMGGPIRAGFQFGIYGAFYGPATQVLASVTAAQASFNPVPMGGLDGSGAVRHAQVDAQGAVMVRHVPTNQAEPSHTELLQQIVGAQRATVHLLTELVALSRGQNGVLPGDEADRLIGEYMNPLNSFVEIIN